MEELTPYKGLRPFDDADSDVPFFFGRDRDRELIIANLVASRLTVLYGETGVGKSSVLRAGVAHHLRAEARRSREHEGSPEVAVAVFDDWKGDPIQGVVTAAATSVRDALGDDALELPMANGSLADRLEAWAALLGGDLYIVLDQTEEFFLYHDADEGARFVAAFGEAVRRPGLRVSFLMSLREDAVAKLDRFKGQVPNVLGNYLRLDYLDRAAGREAILGPIVRYDELVPVDERVEVEPALVEAVLDQVAAGKVELASAGRGAPQSRNGSTRVETPFLQLVMQRLWTAEREGGSRVMRVETLQNLGGAERVVHEHVEHALAPLTPAEKDVAASVFNHLVTPSRTKIAHAPSDLARYADVDERALGSVLAVLTRERILRPVADDDGRERFEIYHDVLAAAVLDWRAAHDTQRGLQAVREAAGRRHRRLAALLAASAALLAVMTGVTAYALTQRSEAQKQAALALTEQTRAEQLARIAQLRRLEAAKSAGQARLAERKALVAKQDAIEQAAFAQSRKPKPPNRLRTPKHHSRKPSSRSRKRRRHSKRRRAGEHRCTEPGRRGAAGRERPAAAGRGSKAEGDCPETGERCPAAGRYRKARASSRGSGSAYRRGQSVRSDRANRAFDRPRACGARCTSGGSARPRERGRRPAQVARSLEGASGATERRGRRPGRFVPCESCAHVDGGKRRGRRPGRFVQSEWRAHVDGGKRWGGAHLQRTLGQVGPSVEGRLVHSSCVVQSRRSARRDRQP